MTKVSIIVPVYKAEKYIQECLNSILCQTYLEWECLLINDGSPDMSGEICEEYASIDSRFRVFHQINEGVSSARNRGLDNMVGDWVMFVDADDVISPNTLEKCISLIEHSKLDLIQFSLVNTKEMLQKNDGIFTEVLNTQDYVKEQKFNVCAGGSFMRAKLIRENLLRFDTTIKLAEDQLFIYNFIDRTSLIQRIGDTLYWYRITDNSATHNQKTGDIVNSIKKLVEYKREKIYWQAIIDRINALFLLDVIRNNDLPTKKIVSLLKSIDLHEESMLYGSCRVLYKISRYNGFLAVISIRLLLYYKKLRKC